jgi:hypothetical protein
MTRIKIFKTYTVLLRGFIFFGSIYSLFGIYMLFKALRNGFSASFPSGDWNDLIFILEGLLFILMGVINLANKKYYLEWDDTELHLFLPDTKKPETIIFEEIESVNIKLFEIQLIFNDRTRIIDLNSLPAEDLKIVKNMFEQRSYKQKKITDNN